MSNVILLPEANNPDNEFFATRLNAGYVRVEKGWHMGDDLLPVEAARMSTGNPTGVDEAKDDATRDFLWRKAHSTPFEMSVLHVEMQCPIFVAREIFRHRVFSFNEFSGRYAVLPNLYYMPSEDRVRSAAQSSTNKQASGGLVDDESVVRFIEQRQIEQGFLRKGYEEALEELGIARELARINLPVSQYTRFRMQGNLRAWFHFLNLRMRSNVMPECRVYAEAIARIISELWPKCWGIFEEYTLYAASLSRTERQAVRWLIAEFLVDLGINDPEKAAEILLYRLSNFPGGMPRKRTQELILKLLTEDMTDEAR